MYQRAGERDEAITRKTKRKDNAQCYSPQASNRIHILFIFFVLFFYFFYVVVIVVVVVGVTLPFYQ